MLNKIHLNVIFMLELKSIKKNKCCIILYNLIHHSHSKKSWTSELLLTPKRTISIKAIFFMSVYIYYFSNHFHNSFLIYIYNNMQY